VVALFLENCGLPQPRFIANASLGISEEERVQKQPAYNKRTDAKYKQNEN
jgi:hypothetical protein